MCLFSKYFSNIIVLSFFVRSVAHICNAFHVNTLVARFGSPGLTYWVGLPCFGTGPSSEHNTGSKNTTQMSKTVVSKCCVTFFKSCFLPDVWRGRCLPKCSRKFDPMLLLSGHVGCGAPENSVLKQEKEKGKETQKQKPLHDKDTAKWFWIWWQKHDKLLHWYYL